jgi:uncharacterized protein (TIGR00255 family)
MTGHGHASSNHDPFAIEVEARTVNNRFLKVSSKISDLVAPIEFQLDGIVRDFIRRGSVSISVRVTRQNRLEAANICCETLRGYVIAAEAAMQGFNIPCSMDLGTMLLLPGVIEPPVATDSEELLRWVTDTIRAALEDLNRMRTQEGEAMASQLREDIRQIRDLRAKIEHRAPRVLEEYRTRLEAKVRSALLELGHSTEQIDIIREVIVFSDRCDIREELVRLASHLDQFENSLRAAESQGRRLDFLVQEMLRETNTIGSKANDAAIAHDVVSIKALIEQVREMVQNVE